MSTPTPEPFSKRFGHLPSDPPITVREDAPEALRYGALQIANEKCGLSPTDLREIVCGVLRKRPNRSNWSEFPNIWDEATSLVDRCEWFRVYDIVEAIYAHLASPQHARRTSFPPGRALQRSDPAETFVNEINQCYRDLGIGWYLVNGLHETRGDDAFEATIAAGRVALSDGELPTTASELTEAIRDISRRPEPDLSGAVQHAMAALESVARKYTTAPKSTLGEIIKHNPDLFPKPVGECVSKAWGYASDIARHAREDRILTFEEAQFMVGLSAVLCTYLTTKPPPNNPLA